MTKRVGQKPLAVGLLAAGRRFDDLHRELDVSRRLQHPHVRMKGRADRPDHLAVDRIAGRSGRVPALVDLEERHGAVLHVPERCLRGVASGGRRLRKRLQPLAEIDAEAGLDLIRAQHERAPEKDGPYYDGGADQKYDEGMEHVLIGRN